MPKNFVIGQANEVVLNGKVYDLHNSYDFRGISIQSTGVATLCFAGNPEYGSEWPSVSIAVEGLDFLSMSEGVVLGRVQDLDELGYKRPGDSDLDWLMAERLSGDDDHLVFRFGKADYIRVHGRSLMLRESSSENPVPG